MTDQIDAKNPYAGSELLARAFDRAVIAGKMTASAVPDAVALLKHSVIVNAKLGTVEIDGLDLDAAVALEIEKRPHWRASGDTPANTERADLMAKAAAGNLTAYAKLKSTMPAKEFEAWQTKTGAQPGRVASAPNKDAGKVDKDNPWTIDGPAGNAARADFIRKHGAAESVAKAREANRTLGGKPLPGRRVA